MNKFINNKIAKISILIIALILLLILISLSLLNQNNGISNLYSTITGKQLTGNNSNIEYKVYDNQDNDKLKVLVIISNVDGIESVTKPDGTIINGNGKESVIFDYIIPLNSVNGDVFSVKSKDGLVENKELKVTEDSIDNLLSISSSQTDTLANVTILDSNTLGNLDNYSVYLYDNSDSKTTIPSNSFSISKDDVNEPNGVVPIHIERKDKGGNILKYEREITTNFPTMVVINNTNYSNYVQSLSASDGSNANKIFTDVWLSNSGSYKNVYVDIELKNSARLNAITMKNVNRYMNSRVARFTVQGSNNGSSYYTIKNFTAADNQFVQTFDVSSSVSYKYYRIISNTAYADSGYQDHYDSRTEIGFLTMSVVY